MVRASPTISPPVLIAQEKETSQEWVPATQRLSFPPQIEKSKERTPASLRLSTAPAPETEQERLPVALRLGPVQTLVPEIVPPQENRVKRKPGRPPGKCKVQASPKTVVDARTGNRKLQNSKAPLCHKRLVSDAGQSSKIPKANTKTKFARTNNPVGSLDSTGQHSDNQLLSDYLPKRKKKMDFQNPSNLVP